MKYKKGMQTITAVIVVFVTAISFTSHASSRGEDKILIGSVENIGVAELGLNYDARIDTGATTSSLHAVDIYIEDESLNPKANIGKTISFTTINQEDDVVELITSITGIKEVRNSQGVETRYMVNLTLELNGEGKELQVNLRDRSEMTYKLLIGRDWLKGDYLVDVEI